MMRSLRQIKGTLSSIRYHQDGFLIGKLGDGTSIKGNMMGPQIGLEYLLHGEWEYHSKWGKQFSFSDYQVKYPTHAGAIQAYLVENAKWIGPETARQVVEQYGEKTLEICKNDPERVAREVKGITPFRAQEISSTLCQNEKDENLQIALKEILSGTKIPKYCVTQIIQRWGQSAPTVLKENPFALMGVIKGIGFLSIDTIARKVGYEKDSPARIRAGIVYTLKLQAGSNGHTCLPQKLLLIEAVKILKVTEDQVLNEVLSLNQNGVTVAVDGFVCLKDFFEKENYISHKLKMMVA